MAHALLQLLAEPRLEGQNAVPVMKASPVELYNPPARSASLGDGAEQGRTRLQEELGLSFNPFAHLDARGDLRLPSYLIGHEDFTQLWGPWPSFLFAPHGGGKTAFRVRLSWACRTQEDERRFFPTVLYLPDPGTVGGLPPNEGPFFAELVRATGHELLFYLAYHAYEFPEWDLAKRRRLRQALAETGIPLEQYLEQIEDAGSLSPLLEAVPQPAGAAAPPDLHPAAESAASSLPREPLPDSLRAFCRSLQNTPVTPTPPRSPLEQLDALWKIILQDLGQEAIFVLVDGADAYPFPPKEAVLLLEPLLKRVREWAGRRVMLKFFLPDEFSSLLAPDLLTEPARVVIIKWPRERLSDVLRERLRVASRGSFDSFKAIGGPGLTRNVEERLSAAADPPVPREVIFLAQQLLADRVWRKKAAHGRLEPEDLQSILDHYRQGRRGRGRGRTH